MPELIEQTTPIEAELTAFSNSVDFGASPPEGTVDVMVDLETLSTCPNAAILSIGACWFNARAGIVARPLHIRVDVQSSIRLGGNVHGDTVRWWLQQSGEARSAVSGDYGAELDDALRCLHRYLHFVAPAESVRVWGDGADFDLAILKSAHQHLSMPMPWRYYNGRCFRTLRKLFPQVAEPPFEGTKHNAADDARHQARHAIAILQAIGQEG